MANGHVKNKVKSDIEEDFDKVNRIVLNKEKKDKDTVSIDLIDLSNADKSSCGSGLRKASESKEQAGFGSIQSVIAQVHTSNLDKTGKSVSAGKGDLKHFTTCKESSKDKAKGEDDSEATQSNSETSTAKKMKRGKLPPLKSTRIGGKKLNDLIQFDSPKKQGENEIKSASPSKTSSNQSEPIPSTSSSSPNTPSGFHGQNSASSTENAYACTSGLSGKVFGRVTSEMISPREFICPITTKIMKQPMSAPDGHIYEKRAISEWIEKHGRSPISGQLMTLEDLQSCSITLTKIREWRKKRRQQKMKMESELNKHDSNLSNVEC